MKLRTKYILFVAMVHAIALVLSWFIFEQNRVFFLGAEVLIIISMLISWNLYRQLLMPLKSLMQGIDAIKDRDFNMKFVPTGKHEVDQLIGVYNEMIEQLRTERIRQEEQHFFLEKMIKTSPTGMIILDHDSRVQQLNPRATEILGMDERTLKGAPISELPEPFTSVISNLRSGDARLIRVQGVSTYKLQRAQFIDRGFARDFIMIEELTAEILAAEKNVYGKVIRMMAHEVNNTIGPVNSIIYTALKSDLLWQGHQHDAVKDALQVGADRNQNLNLFMRNFADLVKLPEPNKKRIDLNLVVQQVSTLMKVSADERQISIKIQAPDQPFHIQADAQQLEQALINILKNSIEAIGAGGNINISIDPAQRQLSITDDGKGITAEQSTQLFTPFYTTKKDGQGIGLALVREILINHGFDLSLKTISEGITVFQIGF